MKQGLILFLAVCAIAAAMVPRDRRAVDTEKYEHREANNSNGTTIQICAPQTPCGWTTYKDFKIYPEATIRNFFCECEKGFTCKIIRDDTAPDTLVHLCRKASADDAEAES